MSWPVLPLGLLGSQASTAAPTTDNDTYQVSRSLRFNSADSAYLSRYPASAGNRKTWTWSGWVKKANSGVATFISADPNSGNRATSFYTRSLTDGRLEFEYFNGTTTYNLTAADLLRDPSSYYHLIIAVDTTQITNTNRTKIYKNGVQLTLSGTYVPQDTDMDINSNVRHNLGRYQSANAGAISYFDGYLAEINFIDGQALTQSSFGETDATTGRWKAKAFTGTYGINGFYLPFLNTSTGSNSVLFSEDFSAAMYTKDASSVTTNTTTAPNGATTADTLTENSATATHRFFYNNLTYTNGVTFTASIYVKANTRSAVNLENWNGTVSNNCYADLSNGTIISGSHASSTITSVGNGWYRISVSNVGTGAAGCGSALYIKDNATAGFLSYAGNGTGSVYVWGAQNEASSVAGPYLWTNGVANSPTLLIGADASVATGGYNTWYPNNLSVTPGTGNDSLTDSPSNYGAISTTLVDDTYQIGKSLRFNSADSAYLSRTPASASNRTTWTWSGWVKRGKFDSANQKELFGVYANSTNFSHLYIDTTDTLNFSDYISGVLTSSRVTNAIYRDFSSWYHIVFIYDTTNATAGDMLKIYVNGVQVTSFSSSTNPTQNYASGLINSTNAHIIGQLNSIYYFDGHLTEINFIDGQALTPSSFGTRDINTYLWKPKAYAGTYGTNGFYLPFSNNSSTQSLGWDQKGNITRYIAPGTYSYTVPTYSSSLVVEVWGGGGGGGQALLPGTDATNGAQSSFNGTVIANGGNRGVGASSGVGANGTGGTASGGDTNTTGNTGNSTAGASSSTPSPNSGNSAIAGVVGPGGYNGITGFPVGSGGGGAYWLGGSVPTAGAGGSGGYSKKTYAPSAISGTITVVVGSGGSAGIGNALPGGAGTDGMVRITVDGATTPSDWYQRNLSVDADSGNDSLVDSPTYYGTLSTTPSEDTYQMSKSVRFKGTNTTMARTPTVAGNRKTWTWSAWVKRSALGTVQQLFSRNDSGGVSNYTYLYFLNDDSIQFLDSNAGSNAGTSYLTTKAKFTDTTNWYHIVLAVDTTQAIESHRQKLYVNGTLTTSFTSISWLGLDSQTQIGTTTAHYIGSNRQTSQFFSGYFAEVNHIDGLALGADSFGVREAGTYLWKPKAYTGAYGTNGFSLKFSDSSTKAALGTDSSGLNNTYDVQGNDFSVATGTLTVVNNDSFIDVPTYYGTDNGAGGEARGSYCTLDPFNYASAGITLANGNLALTTAAVNVNYPCGSTMSVSSGKWYFEVTISTAGASFPFVSIIPATNYLGNAVNVSVASYTNSCWAGNGAFVSGDICGFAFDLNALTFTAYKNGVALTGSSVSSSTITSGLNWMVALSGVNGCVMNANFGQRAFKYTAPAGFKALRDYNKPPVPNGGEVRGNYATLNPLDFSCPGTISNGNLQYVQSTLNPRGGRSTIAVSSGKWYWEVLNQGGNNCPGVIRDTGALTSYIGANADGWGYFIDGQKYNNGTATSYGASYTTNDVIGVALDMDAGTLVFYKNGVSQGTAFSGLSGTMSPGFSSSSVSAVSFTVNFGQRPWAYGAPFGFKPLRDYNKLPTPTGGEVRGNYATWNPLRPNASMSYADGNLGATSSGGSGRSGYGTFGMSSGKWYFETTGGDNSVGVATSDESVYAVYNAAGSYNINGTTTSGKTTYTTSDVIGCAYNADANTIEFFKNGSSQGSTNFSAAAGLPVVAQFSGTFSVSRTCVANFGQRPWAYDAPFGFKPLCTTLLPQPIVQKPSTAMDVVTYTGNGAVRTISGLSFSPDLVWIKNRSVTSQHVLTDSVRGTNKQLFSSLTNGEQTSNSGITSFTSSGFTLGTNVDPVGDTNSSPNLFVAWAWDESPIAGMDIVPYTGTGANRTIGHNLGVVPKMIVCKNRTQAIAGGDDTHWCVYHSSVGSGSALFLNLSNAATANTAFWNSTNPTSSVFSIGTSNRHNYTGDNHIAYLFAEVEGFSKFGSYTGNGLVDGPFVYCGFRPRFVMVKTTGSEIWIIKDTARSVFNGFDVEIYPTSSVAEGGPYTPPIMDYLSNGFKLRSNTSASNASLTYIFAAFAESPFKYSRAR